MSQTNKFGLLLILVSIPHVGADGFLGALAVGLMSAGSFMFMIQSEAHLTMRALNEWWAARKSEIESNSTTTRK